MWEDCPMETVGLSWEVRLAGIGLHTGCKGVSGYCYRCCVLGAIITGPVDVRLEKKKGRFWDEADAGYLLICLVEATSRKCGDGGAGSCCWTIVIRW